MLGGDCIEKDKKKGKWLAKMNRKKKRAAASRNIINAIKTSLSRGVSEERLKIVAADEAAEKEANVGPKKFDLKALLAGK